MIELNVVDGVHRIEDTFVNWYLVEDGDRLTVVDTGHPKSWDSLLEALRQLGRTTADLEAVVLTHAHFDHVGFAERARAELGIPVWAHREEVFLTKHPFRYRREREPILYAWRPWVLPVAASFIRSGALWAPRIKEVQVFEGEGELDLPGRPRVVFTPGHTLGHCALHLPDRGAIISGDGLVTLDPYTRRSGPRIVARAATADSAQAFASLDKMAETGADVVLPGHGDPWREGAAEAAARAREAGIA